MAFIKFLDFKGGLLFEGAFIRSITVLLKRKKVLKTRIKDCAFSSFNPYDENGAPLNLTSEKFATLK